MIKNSLATTLFCGVAISASSQDATFTTGSASMTNLGLFDCGPRTRKSASGEIASADGTVWTVPAATNFKTAAHAADLFNECGGDQLSSLSDLDLASVPLMDAGGIEEFVGYDSSLVSRKIFEIRLVLVASPGFFSRHAQPTKVSELFDVPCLIDTVPNYGARWSFLRGRKVRGPVEISDGEIIRDLALAGMGIAYLPEILVETELTDGLLVEVLPSVSTETLGIYAVFPPHEYISAAARVFAKAVEVAFAKKGQLP